MKEVVDSFDTLQIECFSGLEYDVLIDLKDVLDSTHIVSLMKCFDLKTKNYERER